MPKMKSNRGAAKRFGKTGTGKIKRKKAYLRHILSNKTAKQKRRLRKHSTVAAVDAPQIRAILPYL
jgi:large subunit ribosomal protein L35